MSCCSSSDDKYISSSDEDEIPMRVALSPDGRIVLGPPTQMSPVSSESFAEISPPRDPILLFIVGAGKIATSPTRVRMSLTEEEWEVSPPQDPEILAATGAGELATSPIRLREPLDSDYSYSSNSEVFWGVQRDPGAPLEPIEVLHFHPELNEWRPWRPRVPKALNDNEEKVEEENSNGEEREEEVRRQTKVQRKNPRWRVGLRFFRGERSSREDKSDGDKE